jgi:F420-non-reducing hydrogenase large subunit
MERISIDPITRLEGHGKIDIFLDDAGDVANAYLQVPELRGFERFCVGRPAEEMPNLTARICGVCPEAHHMAATKALDALFEVEPPPLAKKLRELFYNIFYATDHTTHFYALGGPDFVVGPEAPPSQRNILGVVKKVGREIGLRVIKMRKDGHHLIQLIGGRQVHPNWGLPGGVSRGIDEEQRKEIERLGREAIEFARFSLGIFDDVVLGNDDYVSLIKNDAFVHRTYNMGTVDEDGRVNFYDGMIRVTAPDGTELVKYHPRDYLDHVAEHVEPWSYLKFPYLKQVGWKGLVDGPDSGVYKATPLARLNAAEGMATPLAQAEYERLYDTLGGKPVHHTLATHWARLVELLYAAERWVELATDPEITGKTFRVLPSAAPRREPDRGNDEQLRTDQHVDRQGGEGPDPQRHRDPRGAAEQDRDGLSRLRPLHGLRNAQPAGTDAARGDDPRSAGSLHRAADPGPRGSASRWSMKTLVVGLGNPLLTDDRAGLLVARRLRERLADRPDVDVAEDFHGGLHLMERMVGYGRAIVVDAIRTGGGPGTLHRLRVDGLPTQHSASGHDANLKTALEFGRAVGARLPRDEDVLILGIEAAEVEVFGTRCTPPVERAVQGAVEAVVRVLEQGGA